MLSKIIQSQKVIVITTYMRYLKHLFEITLEIPGTVKLITTVCLWWLPGAGRRDVVSLPSPQGAGSKTSQSQTDRSSPTLTPRLPLYRSGEGTYREKISLQFSKTSSSGCGNTYSNVLQGSKEEGSGFQAHSTTLCTSQDPSLLLIPE